MDHPCYKCGHSVEDGKAFCLQCGAPQIRVASPEIAAPVLAASSNSPDLPIFASSGPLASGSPSGLSMAIIWPIAIRSCALSAAIAAAVMAFGLVVPLLAGLGAGVLAVNLYHRRNPAWSVNARSGAQLGAVCGILFFALALLMETLAATLFHTGGEIRQKMLEALQQAASRSADPQVQVVVDRLKTPEGIAVMFAFGLVVLFVVAIAAGSLAGALTGALIGRRKRP